MMKDKDGPRRWCVIGTVAFEGLEERSCGLR